MTKLLPTCHHDHSASNSGTRGSGRFGHRRCRLIGLVGIALLATVVAQVDTSVPASATTYSYTDIATVSVGTDPNGVAIDPGTHTVYVANLGGNTVSVIDGSTNSVTAAVDVGPYPAGVAVDPSTDTVYVTMLFSNTMSVIDGSTNAVTATVSVGGNPNGVAVDPSTDTVYVANSANNTVSVIDGSTNAVTATVDVGTAPEGVTVDPGT
ncbi:MAG: YncE family protein, partial [Acidimicrobiales bacterium]